MIEVEKRIKLKPCIIDRLNKLGVAWGQSITVIDITFGLSGASSMQTHGWVLRLRQDGVESRLEYKAPLDEAWTRWEEIGISIKEPAKAARILLKIGLKPGLVLDRVRREAIWNNVKLTHDKVAFLGEFLEIELLNPSDNNTEKEFARVFKMIGNVELREVEEVAPYGKMLLSLMEHNPHIAKTISEYIDKFMQTGETNK